MMNRRYAAALLVMTIGLASAPAHADDHGATSTWHYDLELDPAPFVWGGHGGVVSVRPDRRWKLGVASYALTYPEAFVFGDNRGFHLDIRPSFNVLINYSLTASTARGGWFVGGMLRQARTTYTHDGAPGLATDVTHYELGVTGGYVWYPFADRGFFAQLWGSVGHFVVGTEDPMVGAWSYHPAAIVPYLAVHLGFEI